MSKPATLQAIKSRPARAEHKDAYVNVRCPAEIWEALSVAAIKARTTRQALALDFIAAGLGVPNPEATN